MRILEAGAGEVASLMKALADETRLRILNLLIERDCCVCEVMKALSISQTRASRHLSQLHDAGLLEQRREGLWTIYFLSLDVNKDYRGLIVEAVEKALSVDESAADDRKRLIANGRLCPAPDQPAAENKCRPS